ncbi:substrate-binding domain-containing protein [Lederbergia sp. NSJ-179]|uniref:substrate-binding domain-containing protein n=1 Tax=Lederbergia sp. NSJ-179 TaxID=2931402 RepID=UPI001FD47CAF|nr:substrate-binding domain-containing protein [Lederbergia sp. NSJ-179]MCJ7843236.1 substrate-binding domain-containing protein [Lederbergia sp. NSJ-179]
MIKLFCYRVVILLIVLLTLTIILYQIPFKNVETNTEPLIDFVIGVSQPNLHEPWQVLMNEELRAEEAKHDNIRVIYADAAQSTKQQIMDINMLNKYGIDLLIVSVEDSSALTPVISAIYKKIPVIVLGRGVEGYNYTLYIGSDHHFIGEMAAEVAIDLLGDEGGKVIEVKGMASASKAEERSKGFREKISENSNIEIIDSIAANWQRDKAEDELTVLLKRMNQRPDLIYAHNDAMALGSYRAVQSLGLEGIKIIGSDGVTNPKGGLQLVNEGIIDTTFITPTGGKQAFQYAVDILEKRSEIPKKVILRNHKVSEKDNIDQYLNQKSNISGKRRRENELTLGFAQVGSESAWRNEHTASVINAAEQLSVNLIFKNADNDQQKQIKIIREFINQEVDVIAFSPKVENGWEEVLKEAKDAGIPVILSDREIDVNDSTLWTSFIGSDFVEEGRRAGRWLINEMDKAALKDVNIIELEGTKNSAPAVGRKQGFEEVLSNYPNYQIIDNLLGDFTLSKGRELMEQALDDHGNKIDIVYAHNDDMAIGAIEAIEDYGLKPGRDIKIISIDATIKAFNALSTGKLNFTVECNPLLGPQIMQAAKELHAGKEVPMKIITSEETFTQEEAKKEMKKRNY